MMAIHFRRINAAAAILVLLVGCVGVEPTALQDSGNQDLVTKPVIPLGDSTSLALTPTSLAMPMFLGGSLGETRIRSGDGMQMVYVPGGNFQMGSDESDPAAEAGEFPAHTVTLDGFWIDQTEVNNARYTLCVEAGACQSSSYAGNPAYNGDDLPVVGVAWQDASDYCAWAGGRLPTEAEWEYAARGEGHIYPWGNAFDSSRLNFCDVNCSESWADTAANDGYAENAPVGSYPDGDSWVGALDMAGNVWEWVWDWYSDYGPDPQTNPQGPESGFYKIIRGGCWASWAEGVRTTYRFEGGGDIRPMIRHPNIGFRCVITPS